MATITLRSFSFFDQDISDLSVHLHEVFKDYSYHFDIDTMTSAKKYALFIYKNHLSRQAISSLYIEKEAMRDYSFIVQEILKKVEGQND